jgi:DNA modification methylase
MVTGLADYFAVSMQRQVGFDMADRAFLERLSRELTDQGKLIEAGWVSLRLAAIPLDASALQLQEMSAETFLDGRVTMLLGDVREMLKTLPDDHFDCVCTSPPYWGLRSYLPDGHEDKHKEIGCERTLGEHLAVMVSVFEEVRRVLKPTGTFWLNYGDCYATSPNGRSAADTKSAGNDDRTFRDKPFSTIGAIQSRSNGGEGQHHDRRGAIFVADHESGDRRGTTGNKGSNGQAAHGGRVVAGGYLKPKDLCMIPNRLAIALQDAGWWVRSEIIWHKPNPMPESISDRPTTSHEKIWLLTKSERYHFDSGAIAEPVQSPNKDIQRATITGRGLQDYSNASGANGRQPQQDNSGGFPVRDKENPTRNSRNVWTIGTAAFSEAHFATFPPEIPARCIKAGCPIGGSVLDPFGGSGTVGLVAASLGRTATLIELNPEYAIMARARIEAAFMGREEGARHMTK